MSQEPEGLGETIEADLQRAICDVLSRHERSLVTRWVGLVETVDPDGERGIWTFTSEGLQPWDALGLLTYGLQVEKAHITKRELED